MLRIHATRLVALCATLTPALAAVRPASSLLEFPQPEDPLALLHAGVGAWEGTLTYFQPGLPTEPLAARQVVEAISGAWTQARLECELAGLPYVGTGALGYDAARKRFVGTWIDSLGDELVLQEGEVEAESKALVLRWKARDRSTGLLVPHRSETLHTQGGITTTTYAGAGRGRRVMVLELKPGADACATDGVERTSIVARPDEPTIVMSRLLDAPRRLVFEAWTRPAHLTRWWVPPDSTLPVCEVDLRPGGAYRFVERGADGREFGFSGVYREVVPGERLVYTERFDGAPQAEALVTMTLAEEGGKTRLTGVVLHQTLANRDAHFAAVEQGAVAAIDRLAEHLRRWLQ